MTDDPIQLDRLDQVAVITLNNPPANTFTMAGLYALDARLQELEQDTSISALVLTGRGDKFFCAGDDLNMFLGADRASARDMAHGLACALDRLTAFPGVTIAAINGYCLGGGLECALACDLRIGESQARLGLPETKVGLLPCGGGTQRLPWLVGEGWAKRLILCGEQVDADTALRIGLIEEIAATGKAYDSAIALARQTSRQGPRAVAASKRLIDHAQQQAQALGHAREGEAFSALFDSDEPAEGIHAFLDKREPNWKRST